MSKKALLLIAICYTLVLLVFSLITINSLPKLGSNYDDKIFHVLAYIFLVLLWHFTLHSLKIPKAIFIAVLFSISYGIIIEVIQGQLTTVRNFDLLDVLANCIGVAIASLFIMIRNRIIVKNL